MPLLNFELTSFSGLHTQPAKVEGGMLYAEDIRNLRIDGDGWLRLRPQVETLAGTGQQITGIAASQNHLFLLRNTGLFVSELDRTNSTLGSETEITGTGGLDGRLSLVQFGNYVILTSEGPDRGYFVVLDADHDFYLQAVPFGIDGPRWDDFREISGLTNTETTPFFDTNFGRGITRFITQGINSLFGIGVDIFDGDDDIFRGEEEQEDSNELTTGQYYHYRWSYVSLRDTADPWYGMESPLSDNHPDSTDDTAAMIRGFIHLVNDQVWTHQILGYGRDSEIVTHIRFYRSNAFNDRRILSPNTRAAAMRPLQYRRIAEIPIDHLNVHERSSISLFDRNSDMAWAGSALAEDNSHLPAEANAIHKFNDLVFAPTGDRLVYSDLRNGNITPWAFPAVNDIRVNGHIAMCAEVNEVLLFGSTDGLWRLTGGTEYDFRVGQISGNGPIDAFAWDRTTDALAFVGEGGLFLTDASQVSHVSKPALTEFFQNRTIDRGAVAFQKDGDILFHVAFNDGFETQFKVEDGYWVRWDVPFVQTASIDSLLYLTDKKDTLKRIDWNNTENTEIKTWDWTSQILDNVGQQTENKRKNFKWLQFTGASDNIMTLQVWKGNETTPVLAEMFRARDNLQPVRIPINRIDRRLRFKISGAGPVTIQGLTLGIMI